MKTKIQVLLLTLAILMLTIKASYPAVWPINNSSTPDQITSDFGPRVTSSGAGFHWGIDVRARTPQPVHAITGGTIEAIEINVPKAGNYVKVGGIRYLHLSHNYNGISFIEATEVETKIKYKVIIIKNVHGIVTKVLAITANLRFDEISGPPSTDTLSEGEIFAYSGSSGTTDPDPHLHIDKGQPGSNPLRDLPYTGIASNIEAFELEPSGPQVSGKVKIIAGVKSCSGGGACSWNDIPDLNEVKIDVGGETVYNPKFDSRNADAGDPYIYLPGGALKKGIYPITLGKELFVGINS